MQLLPELVEKGGSAKDLVQAKGLLQVRDKRAKPPRDVDSDCLKISMATICGISDI